MIFQAIVGTFGVFFGMLVVYKTGAIRVTPKFTRFMVGAIFGVVALSIGNICLRHLQRTRRPLTRRRPAGHRLLSLHASASRRSAS